eukprot:11170259-Lingulodinium_polyedra.AAC.1
MKRPTPPKPCNRQTRNVETFGSAWLEDPPRSDNPPRCRLSLKLEYTQSCNKRPTRRTAMSKPPAESLDTSKRSH